jgi:hypothetical protein
MIDAVACHFVVLGLPAPVNVQTQLCCCNMPDDPHAVGAVASNWRTWDATWSGFRATRMQSIKGWPVLKATYYQCKNVFWAVCNLSRSADLQPGGPVGCCTWVTVEGPCSNSVPRITLDGARCNMWHLRRKPLEFGTVPVGSLSICQPQPCSLQAAWVAICGLQQCISWAVGMMSWHAQGAGSQEVLCDSRRTRSVPLLMSQNA